LADNDESDDLETKTVKSTVDDFEDLSYISVFSLRQNLESLMLNPASLPDGIKPGNNKHKHEGEVKPD
jgi:hypothetical protein